MYAARALATFVALVALGACVSTSMTPGEAEQVTKACRSEVGADGTYQIRMVSGVPEAWPIVGAYGLKDGTEAGAAALNACIKRKASSSGAVATNASQPLGSCKKSGSPLQGGSGYC
jgi:hypothetical protein